MKLKVSQNPSLIDTNKCAKNQEDLRGMMYHPVKPAGEIYIYISFLFIDLFWVVWCTSTMFDPKS